ncbi:MAG: shikimate kinase [Anaerolineae bacterium]
MNLILTGFMGTGKSTVGRLAAARLGLPFIDMDAEIEHRAGMPITAIFATQGEAAFRHMERELARELAAHDNTVIATGGGALIDPVNRELLEANGLIICLSAAPVVLAERLAASADRPLLQHPDPARRIAELLAARASAYASLPHHIDTTDLSPEQITEAIITLWHTHKQST